MNEIILEKLVIFNQVPEGKFGSPLQKPYEDFVKANEYTVRVLRILQEQKRWENSKKKYKNDAETLEYIEENIKITKNELNETMNEFEEWHNLRKSQMWE